MSYSNRNPVPDTVIQLWISNINFFMRIGAVLDDNSTVSVPDDE